jgi:hypothetical protein
MYTTGDAQHSPLHSPVANAKANALALPFAEANGKWRMKDEG